MPCEGHENKISSMVSRCASDWFGCESDVSWSHHVLQTIWCQVSSNQTCLWFSAAVYSVYHFQCIIVTYPILLTSAQTFVVWWIVTARTTHGINIVGTSHQHSYSVNLEITVIIVNLIISLSLLGISYSVRFEKHMLYDIRLNKSMLCIDLYSTFLLTSVMCWLKSI